MSSGTEIIQAALMRIGAHSVISPADPESIETGRDTLNSMLEMWRSKQIDMDTIPLNAPGDELNEPLDAKQGITDNLALMLAPNFDNGKQVVSPDLRRAASIGMQAIRKLYQQIEIPKKKVSSTMPVGAINSKGVLNSPFTNTRELDS